MTRVGAAALIAALMMSVGCDDSPTSPDAATTTTTTSSVVFEGTLAMNGSAFYSFNISQAGIVSTNLASLVLVGHREALTVPVRIGVGIPKGEGCALAQSTDVAPALIAQLNAPLSSTGIYCVGISDIGALTASAVFSIRFSHP